MTIQPWENPVKAALKQGRPVVAATVTANSVDSAAQLAAMGFDFLWIEMEHSPVTLETLRHIVLATRGAKALPFARVPVNELWTAKRVLDAGVHGVIFPFTSTPELAEQAAAACRSGPHGRRGSCAGLSKCGGPGGGENVDALAAASCVDVMFIGTSDLSFSLGLRGRQKEAELDAAIQKVLDAGKRHNKPVGRPAGSPEQIKQYIDQGFLLFQAPTDIGFMTAGAKRYLEPLEKARVQKEEPRAL